MSERIPLVSVGHIVVFVNPGQLLAGRVELITLCDADPLFELNVARWKSRDAICLYDGPPQPPKK
jgi:hypothetical protein